MIWRAAYAERYLQAADDWFEAHHDTDAAGATDAVVSAALERAMSDGLDAFDAGRPPTEIDGDP
ncbi:MAG: hypothetical protein OXB99_06350 [Acidimicrobiaceae bacterium]|nr:hypothetical protein [Acidimicrobiaceae bacterium]